MPKKNFLKSLVIFLWTGIILAASWTFRALGWRACRFHPTCSAYALESLEKHRVLPAVLLSIRRVLRCHPAHSGGYDPVPEA